MKVSLNWVRELSGVTIKTPELVELIGTRLGAIEGVEEIGQRYGGIVVVKVMEVEPHPDADKLHVCKVDDKGAVKNVKRDSKGLVQVVCGAPNVKAGMLVAWIPPGAAVPSTFDKELFKIESKELRGVMSHGMLASAHELDLGDDHSGLLELDGVAKAGASFAKTYELDDTIIDIENKMFTHRPDCFGQLGVAREIAGITHKKFNSPGWYKFGQAPTGGRRADSLKLTVKNQIPKLVPRFCAVTISGVTVSQSPVWLKAALAKLGIKPINNIVDLTNYMMLLTAQPLHAYDYDKLATGQLGARLSKKGESLKLLGGKTISLSDGLMVITDGSKAISLGGVMGGAETEVDGNTKNIVLEAATFDMGLTRKAAYEYGLFTDAATRFTKGQSPLQQPVVLKRALELLEQLAGGQAHQFIDDSAKSMPSKPVEAPADFINSRLGTKLGDGEMKRLLENVEIGASGSGKLKILSPFWRTDIEIAEDVVEEVGRLRGYENLKLELPKRDIAPSQTEPNIALKSKIRKNLVELGADELLTYSFVGEKLLRSTGQEPAHCFRLSNPISPDHQFYRTSLMPSLLDKVHSNIKAGFGSMSVFEIGRVHYVGEMDEAEPKIPNEDNHVALVVAYDQKYQPKGSAYYYARNYLSQLKDPGELELVPLVKFDLSNDEWGKQLVAPYEPARSAVIVVDGQVWGVLGEFKESVRQALKLPVFTAGLEVHLDILRVANSAYQPLNRFPELEQDICLQLPSATSYHEVTELINLTLHELSQKHGYQYEVSLLDIFQKKSEPAKKQITWRISLWHSQRTLVSAEANEALDEIADSAKRQLNGARI